MTIDCGDSTTFMDEEAATLLVKIPDHINELKSYKPGKPIPEIKAELGLEKVSVLWNNENNFGPSPKAMEMMRAAIENSHVYPDPTSKELRTAHRYE